MQWQRHDVVWQPGGEHAWARSHATCPTPLRRRNGVLRVYLQCRDAAGIGRIGWIDLDPDDPRRLITQAEQPVLDIGAPGSFDDNGVFPTSVLRTPDGRVLLYYVGFELCHHIRYRLLTGLAISHDDGDSFERVSTMPVLERSAAEPHFRCGTFVRHERDRFRMWYVAGGQWDTIDGKPLPVYDLRIAESLDGIHWPAQGECVMPLDAASEHGFGRPWVLEADGDYEMFYSVRRRTPAGHRLGHARSPDGVRWHRLDDQLGLAPQPGAWDGEGQCYAAPIDVNGKRWLLYNGNDFGRTGVGLAEQVSA
jgi:predicted GH43/DUF377 family glycosyl hydrolase